MGHRAKVGLLLLSVATLGLNPPGRAVSSATIGLTASSTHLSLQNQVVVAAPRQPDRVDKADSLAHNRLWWGLLALLSLLLVLMSGVTLSLCQRRQVNAAPGTWRHAVGQPSGAPTEWGAQSIASAQDNSPAAAPSDPAQSLCQGGRLAASTDLDATTRLVAVNIVDTLVEELTSADPAVRRKAIWELGQRGHSAAIQPLVNSMLDADSRERSLTLAALAEISSRSFKPLHQALALSLQDPSPEVRKNAIRDLTRLYDTAIQLSHLLAHATQDEHPEVQATARWALEQLNQMRSPLLAGEAPAGGASSGAFSRLPEPRPPQP